MKDFVKQLNYFYLNHKELYEKDYEPSGFRWIAGDDNNQNVLSFSRYDNSGGELVFAVNFSPVQRDNYHLGVDAGEFEEVFNTDWSGFGGNNVMNWSVRSFKESIHGKNNAISVTLPPLSAIFLKRKNNEYRIN